MAQWLIVGLGNPGDNHANTRHNTGFMVVDAFAEKYSFSAFALDKNSRSLVAEGFLEHQKVVLAKPQTLMNNSGKAVFALYQKYRIRDLVLEASGRTEMEGRHLRDAAGLLIDRQTFLQKTKAMLQPSSIRYKTPQANYLILVHDDIDLALGRIKISVGSGAAGHKGVESVISALGTQDFARLRIGIQPEIGKPKHVEEFVLTQFSIAEKPLVQQAMENALAALDSILHKGIQKVMSEWN